MIGFVASAVILLLMLAADAHFGNEQDENRRDVNALAKASLNLKRKERRRKYTWQNPGTGNSAGK